MLKVAILGGDGFCGWPVALRLSHKNEVHIIDNLSRRDIDEASGSWSLTPISSPEERIHEWLQLTGKTIGYQNFNVGNYAELRNWLETHKPEVVIHLAEQRSAPFSMISSLHRSQTILGNIQGTLNLLEAVADLNLSTRIIHIGSMGVYGYDSAKMISEGYDEHGQLLPFFPGSAYHLSKVLDHYLLQFYQKFDKLKVVDLHQGIVWGTQTKDTLRSEKLINRYDFDGEYGTVVNRFIVEAACSVPLTIYGKGTQQRTFIHLEDAVSTIEQIIESPADANRVLVRNIFTEIKTLNEIAELVAGAGNGTILPMKNPRNEKEDNLLRATTQIAPTISLTDEHIKRELAFAKLFSQRFSPELLRSHARWSRE